jgi:hypothetical protein
MENETGEIYMNEIVMEKKLWKRDMKNLSLQIETNKRPKNEDEWMNSIFQNIYIQQKMIETT